MAHSHHRPVRWLRPCVIAFAFVATTVVPSRDSAAADRATTIQAAAAACEHVKVPGPPLVDAAEPTLDPFESGAFTQSVVVSGEPLPELTAQIADGDVDDPALCAAVPVISGYGFDGQPVGIDPVADGPTLIVASAHWCGHCDTEIDVLLSLQAAGELPPALSVVGLSSSLQADGPNYPPDEWLESRGWRWPVLVDSRDEEARLTLGVISYPNLILADDDGLVRWRSSGVTDAETIAAAVDEVLDR